MKLNHLDLQVSDVPSVTAFLVDHFDLEPVTRRDSPKLAILTDGHGFTLVLQHRAPDAGGGGLGHLGFLLDDPAEVYTRRAGLAAAGLAVSEVTSNGRGTQCYCRGPSDLLVEVGCNRSTVSVRKMTQPADASHHLFSYGTLQLEAVQLATFGRKLEGAPDALPGYALSMVAITDPDVVATSGAAEHPIVKFSGAAADSVAGTVFTITAAELESADRYEVAAYKRVAVTLASGLSAWVYVDARYAPPG